MGDKQKYLNNIFIGRWIEGNLSKEEELQFNDWLKKNPEYQNEFEGYIRIWEDAPKINLKPGKTLQQRWQKLYPKLNSIKQQKLKILNFKNIRDFSFVAVAATIIFAVYLWNSLDNTIDIFAPKGKQIVYNLPDGSIITLNAGTKIKYNPKKWETNRFVIMSGEAFFKVKSGNLFVVKTGNIYSTVLGTSFNINTRNDKVEVACITGKVQVQSERDKESSVILTPGLLCKVSNDGTPEKSEKFNIQQKTGWIKGEFYFSNAPLKEVFLELERQFSVQIKYQKEIGDQTFTGRFNNKNMNNAFEMVSLAAGLNFSFESESIVLIYSAE